MIVASLPTSDTCPRTAASRAAELAAVLISIYLTLALWPMQRYAAASGEVGPLVAHVAVLLVALASTGVFRDRVSPLTAWLPLVVGPFLYIEMRWLVPGTGRPLQDALVQRWELATFGGQPSTTWAPAMPNVALSELLHFCYASYYLLVYVPPLLLWLRGRREPFARTLLGLTFVYGSCFAAYLFFPVEGPRFLNGPAAAPDGPIRSFVLHLLAKGSSRGTAFPSSHIAASVVAALSALQFQRRVGIVVALLTVGLTIGTVYGGFHYGVDGIAGAGLGVVTWLLAGVVWRMLSRQGEQSATAA